MSSNLPSEMLMANESITRILKKASDVSVIKENIIRMAWDVLIYMNKAIQNEEFKELTSTFTRYADIYPDVTDIRAADWIFVLHTLNFSLWSPKDTAPWTVNGFTGFSALCAAMKRAINEGKSMWDPKYYKELYQNPKDVEIIFRSDNKTCIPLLKDRIDILNEVGEILMEKYNGTFITCLKLCKNGTALLSLLLKNFPLYQETKLEYEGEEVTFCLKATTLMTDITCFFHKHEILRFEDSTMRCSAMFIDCRCIQIFLCYNALYYTDRLQKKIEENDILEYKSAENLEILASSCSIRSRLHAEVINLLQKYKTKDRNKIKFLRETPKYKFEILIDNFLWDYRHMHDQCLKDLLFHNVRSVYF